MKREKTVRKNVFKKSRRKYISKESMKVKISYRRTALFIKPVEECGKIKRNGISPQIF